MKLQEVAENIAYKLGGQFNNTLKESIKQTLIIYRAKYIRDDIERNGIISNSHFTQYFQVPLEEVNLITEFGNSVEILSSLQVSIEDLHDYIILKSVNKVPKPIRLKQITKDMYTFVGTINATTRFVFTTLDKFPFIRLLDYNEKTIYYTVINDYFYILNNLACEDILDTLKIKNLLVMGIFEDPRTVWTFCNSEGFIDDNEFPIGADMLMSIQQNILRGEYPLLGKDGQQVNIKPDDNH